jgi:hypothetical protein
MALGVIAEFETGYGILVTEYLSKFESLIFEQGDEVALRVVH